MKKILSISLYLLPLLGISQLDSTEYNQFLKEIMKVQSVHEIFPTDSIFSNEKYISYLKGKYENATFIYDSASGGYQKHDTSLWIKGIGIKTSRLSKDRYFELNFYDEFGLAKGPDWWFYNSGMIKIKRFWDQSGDSGNSNIIRVREYSEIRFYKSNGGIKRTGHFKNDKKVGIWFYYKKNGDIKKQKNYG